MIAGQLCNAFRNGNAARRLMSVQLPNHQKVQFVIAFTAGDPGDKHKDKKKKQQEKAKPKTPTPAPTPTKEMEKADKGGDKKKK